MQNSELDRIIENMDIVFRGDAWHGPSVMEILNSLPPHAVTKKSGNSKHTIAELVFHLKAWRVFVFQKLQNNIHFSLQTETDNFGNPTEVSEENWPNLVNDLKEAHSKLLQELEKFDDTLLSQRVAGEHYDFYTLLHGIIQHDTYHLGMIWVLWD